MTDTVSQPTEQGLAQATSYTKSNAAQDSTLQHKTNPQELEHRYYQYLRDHQYASTDALVHVLRWYLPYFEGFPRVLDIGCGHGEFLQLLTEQGHDAVGIDIDPAMVATCRERGLTAYEGDAISWLQGQEAAFDAIFSSNVIEHLDAPTVQALIQRAHTALRPGGLLLIGTPNPESFIVQFHEFWRDPTHVRLYSRQLIEFFYADAGFIQIQNGNNAEAAWDGFGQMLDPTVASAIGVEALTHESAVPVEHNLPPLHPLPEPPPAGASLRQRLAFRALDFVYRKFLEPYVALMRLDQAQQRQQIEALQIHIARLQENNLLLEKALRHSAAQSETRFQQASNALHFQNPPREHFVYGYKASPTKNNKQTLQEGLVTNTSTA